MKGKKLLTIILAFVLIASLSVGLAGCVEVDTGEAQGVLAEKILIGNTAATTGDYATVGVPFNAGLNAALKVYNDSFYGGKKIELIHYDDGFDGATGLTLTKKLVEEDKVFALVGHFGTNTVAATLDYIKNAGIPMVYAATGINDLYQEAATGNNRAVMPVQPIYKTEGRVLVARALAAEGVAAGGLGGTKLGVISTTDDAGIGMLEGINRQLQELSTVVPVTKVAVGASDTDYNSAIATLKNAGCDVVIAACNQAPLGKVMAAMSNANFNAKVITSYVNAAATTLGGYVTSGYVTADRPIYTTAWLDTGTAEGLADYFTFYYAMSAYEAANEITVGTYALNSYAMAGFLAGNIFVQGIQRVAASGKLLTWDNFIDAMEDGELDLLMGGSINYANGSRLGVADLALNTITLGATPALSTVDGITSFDAVWAKVPASYKK